MLAARPDRLYEVRPQDRVLRRTVEQNVDAVTFPFLDVLEPQMGNQLVEVLPKIDTRSSHQVIEVPKIFPVSVPQRLVESRPPQLAEQLVEVPTDPVYVLMVLASKVFSRRELRGFLSGQGSTASGSRVVDNPVPQGRGGGGARVPHRVVCVTMHMRLLQWFFRTFPRSKKGTALLVEPIHAASL